MKIGYHPQEYKKINDMKDFMAEILVSLSFAVIAIYCM